MAGDHKIQDFVNLIIRSSSELFMNLNKQVNSNPQSDLEKPAVKISISKNRSWILLTAFLFLIFLGGGVFLTIKGNSVFYNTENKTITPVVVRPTINEIIAEEQADDQKGIEYSMSSLAVTSSPTPVPITSVPVTSVPATPSVPPKGLSITSVIPSYLPMEYVSLGKTHIIVTGDGFQQGAKISIVASDLETKQPIPGVGEIQVSDVTFLSQIRLEGTIPPGLSNNYFQIIVTNPDGGKASSGMSLLRGGDPNEK